MLKFTIQLTNLFYEDEYKFFPMVTYGFYAYYLNVVSFSSIIPRTIHKSQDGQLIYS